MSSTGSSRLANASTDANGNSHISAECDRCFCTNRGLNQHVRSGYLKKKSLMFKHHMKEIKTMQKIKHLIEIPDISTPSLRYKWGNYQEYLFERDLSLAYKKIVYWQKNPLLLPSRQVGKSFIDEISKLMNEWIHESPLKDIVFKAIW